MSDLEICCVELLTVKTSIARFISIKKETGGSEAYTIIWWI